MTEWKPAVKPRHVCGVDITTIRASATNETGHEFALNGHTVRVLPDGRTRSRQRSCSISDALADADRLDLDNETTLRVVLGSLLLLGADNLWIDGERLTSDPGEARGQWIVTLRGDGSVDSRFVGGVE